MRRRRALASPAGFHEQVVAVDPRVHAESLKPLHDGGQAVGLFHAQLADLAEHGDAARVSRHERNTGTSSTMVAILSAGTSHPCRFGV